MIIMVCNKLFRSRLASGVLVVLCFLAAVTESVDKVLRWSKVRHTLQSTSQYSRTPSSTDLVVSYM